jgi:hypothetical protein
MVFNWGFGISSASDILGNRKHDLRALDISYISLHIVFHFFALVLIHFVLLARFVAQISTSFSILVPCMWVLYHNFYCIFSGYLPPN